MLPWKHEVNVHHHAYATVKSLVAVVDQFSTTSLFVLYICTPHSPPNPHICFPQCLLHPHVCLFHLFSRAKKALRIATRKAPL